MQKYFSNVKIARGGLNSGDVKAITIDEELSSIACTYDFMKELLEVLEVQEVDRSKEVLKYLEKLRDMESRGVKFKARIKAEFYESYDEISHNYIMRFNIEIAPEHIVTPLYIASLVGYVEDAELPIVLKRLDELFDEYKYETKPYLLISTSGEYYRVFKMS